MHDFDINRIIINENKAENVFTLIPMPHFISTII